MILLCPVNGNLCVGVCTSVCVFMWKYRLQPGCTNKQVENDEIYKVFNTSAAPLHADSTDSRCKP